ncbi:MAG: YeeE/YedE family protein [Defluviitaleaceae bacterium]|nr:YeeE/YedE family protein [Defluviitaleaceae bacterium]
MKTNKNIYLLGAALGVLAILSTLATTYLLGRTNFLGTSTTFVRAAALIERLFLGETVYESTYYSQIGLRVDWQFMLVIGITIGALISSLSNKTFKIEFIPPIWKERYGNSVAKRGLFAFIGGIFAMYGARLAGGCPSGHGISGFMQLSVSGFMALFIFFVFGALIAQIMYKKRGVKA